MGKKAATYESNKPCVKCKGLERYVKTDKCATCLRASNKVAQDKRRKTNLVSIRKAPEYRPNGLPYDVEKEWAKRLKNAPEGSSYE